MKELVVTRKEIILGRELRVFGDMDNPLFLAKDIAEWIGHTHITKMLEIVGGKDVCTSGTVTDSIGRQQEMRLLTEKQVYRILMRSDKPIATEIQDGIFEFLKAWRKGEVKVVPTVDKKQELLLGLFSADPLTVANSHKALIALEVKPLVEKIEQQAPKVEYHDTVLKSDKLSTVSMIAKDLGMSAQSLNKRLHDMKIQYKKGRTWMFYSEHEDKIPEYADYHISEFGQTLKFTEIGRKWIIELLEND